ncbi:hypothetical protein [Streptomyces indicus]|uniref:Uncharacterized protein n=1 Tax=Streptomyces indicus TaxID=417292 RepID=A0A1G8W9I3_9ACTN|nr:hypothetical protein [Streptomyces indicus]SDJ74395.1 hypothetical protein SAMN05421806_102294 [Streptomyces indicus]
MPVRAVWLTTRGDAAGGQTRNDTRLAPLGAMTPAAELTTAPGVIPGGDPFELAATGPMTATLATGRAIVQGTIPQGAYPVAITAPEALVFADGDPANSRIDLVVLRIYDTAYDSSGQTLATVEIIPGTPGAAPTPPPTPAGALALYRVQVAAGLSAGSGGIDFPAATTDVRRYTTAVGGITPYSVGGAYRGQYRDTGTGLQRFTGTTWSGLAAEIIGWTKASLASGYGHNGNSNGDVRYRVIDLLGTRFVQWRGGMNVSYSRGAPRGEGKFLRSVLPSTARPTGLRTVPVACSASNSTILALKADFHTNGTAVLLSDPGDAPPWVSLNGVMYAL